MSNKIIKSNKKGNFLKIIIIALALAFVAVGSIIISDLLKPKGEVKPEMETVTVTVSGTEIHLNGSESITLEALEQYLKGRFENNDYCTIALINDTKTPADIGTYNDVVELLGDFGITQEKLTLPATEDELKIASIDEV